MKLVKILNKVVNIAAYLLIATLLCALIDVFVFNRMMDLGNSRFRHNLVHKYIMAKHPYTGFIEQRLAAGEPYSMYYNGTELYKNNENKIRIAFFGGSTSAYNDPEKPDSKNIPQYLEQKLKQKLNKDVVVLNYACGGAHHRQHLHMLLEFLPKFKPDIVVFYGGNNETVQYYEADPRPGYPMNFFYEAEFQTWKKFLIQYSAVLSHILGNKFEARMHNVLNNRVKYKSPEWKQSIINNYLETLHFSRIISESFKSDLFNENTKFIAVFQPVRIMSGYDSDVMDIISGIRKRLPAYAYDFYNKYDNLPESIWYDICHVKDEANQLMADEISELLINKYLKKYKK